MKVTFLYHSAFLVELDTCTLLFDWYTGPVPDYDRAKPLYVFASHHHGDHYSPEIFPTFGMENVWYVLGSCIRLSAKRKAALGIQEDHVFRLGADRTLSLGPLTIQTLHSTDEGVAFLIQAEGKTLFHAGDLQWWQWEGEPAQWNRDMERDFKHEAEKLHGKTIDAAFLVLDPRQEDAYWWGFDWFMKEADIRCAFPMHSWEEFTMAKRLKEAPCSEGYRDRIVDVRYNGQTFDLP
jgi:L-ascorbate metabolism protein UlaG (beta-lactamase superfamily)